MNLKGVRIVRGKAGTICFIDDFSIGLQEEIKNRLSDIFHGASEVNSSPIFYSYSNTLKSFVERYNTKDEDTKKGIIGELLAHLLYSTVYTEHKSISILKNKEERSIKKGFDIVYFDSKEFKIWYSEVKSGKSSTAKVNSTKYNTVLLDRSKSDIDEKLSSNRNSIWESAMIDATLTIEDHNQRLTLKQLLSSDSPVLIKDISLRKNAIMISVLYHDLSDEIEIASIEKFYENTVRENKFLNVIAFSIQKATYEKIARFIESEVK